MESLAQVVKSLSPEAGIAFRGKTENPPAANIIKPDL